jgi:quinohemoprotein ethanol dehydrogenase
MLADHEGPVIVAILGLALVGCGHSIPASAPSNIRHAAGVNAALHADPEAGQWFTPGRDAGGTYYSSLSEINAKSVAGLGFAWQYALGTARGLEASPVVIDGVMYAVGNYGRVYAVDAASGSERWRFTPVLDNQWIRFACCDAVNRGVAVRNGRVYVGALDGYLYALDAATGKPVWRTDTLIGRERHIPYTLTGAPVLTHDAVVIGNGGSDFKGVRGYVSAFDLESGKLKWRFFTVPRDPTLGPQDQPHLVQAVKTWDPRHEWQYGGGGTVWDGLSYDEKYDLVFMGTGNVAPYNTRQDGRSGGEGLYACSVVAVHAASGELAWYFQEVPDDRWDFDSDQKFIMTKLQINGAQLDVLLHAAKDGYFYVFERASGKVLSAKNFTFVNWTKGLDPQTHRPIPNPAANYDKRPALVWPSAAGAHSWQPMSFDPQTGLVYIPVIEMSNVLVELSARPAKSVEGWFTVQGIEPGDYDPARTKSLYGALPSLEVLEHEAPGPIEARGILKAWDPANARAVWAAAGTSPWDGGIMTSGGNLVFRGDANGFLNVHAADTGRLLRRIEIGTSIMAAPVTYTAKGEQYVAFMAGYGGAAGFQFPPESAAYKYGSLAAARYQSQAPFAMSLLPSRPSRQGPRSARAEGKFSTTATALAVTCSGAVWFRIFVACPRQPSSHFLKSCCTVPTRPRAWHAGTMF